MERHKSILDALSGFVKAHPKLVTEYPIHQLHGKLGLKFGEFALIVPYVENGKPVLRMVKPGEDWMNSMDGDDYYRMERTVANDVSKMSENKLAKLLDRLYRQANPDADDEEDDE